MSTIQTADARGLFTKMVISIIDREPTPTMFLKSFFKEKITRTKEVSLEVRRNHELVSADVIRGAGSVHNRFDNSTEKIYVPPYFNEDFFLNELDHYDRIFAGQQEVDADVYAMLLELAAKYVMKLKYKIMRKQELMCAQAFQTGEVTLVNGDNINFRREADSLGVLGTNDQWTATDVNPLDTLEAGGDYLRTRGLVMDDIQNVILGQDALRALLVNPAFQSISDNRRYEKLADINSPMAQGNGSKYHGIVSANEYVFRLWSYPQYYNTVGSTKSTKTRYIDKNKIIILPDMPMFSFAYANVPMIKRDLNNAEYPEYIVQASGDFHLDNYMDPRKKNHVFEVQSACLPILDEVDAIYTSQVVA